MDGKAINKIYLKKNISIVKWIYAHTDLTNNKRNTINK